MGIISGCCEFVAEIPVPQTSQKVRTTVLPLSAVLQYSRKAPWVSLKAARGKAIAAEGPPPDRY